MGDTNSFKFLEQRRSRVAQLEGERAKLEQNQQDLQAVIENAHTLLPNNKRTKYAKLDATSSQISQAIQGNIKNKAALERNLRKLQASRVNFKLLSFWHYLSGEQRQLRRTGKRLARDLARTKKSLAKGHRQLTKLEARKRDLVKRVSTKDDTNLSGIQLKLDAIPREIQKIDQSLRVAKSELQRVEEKVGPFLREVDQLTLQQRKIDSDIAKANRFTQQLNKAQDARDRARIHKKCENQLGDGSPSRVIEQLKRKRQGLERSIEKNEARISKELTILNRTIRHLLIDGSNACYEQGGEGGIPSLASPPFKRCLKRSRGALKLRWCLIPTSAASCEPKTTGSDKRSSVPIRCILPHPIPRQMNI